MIISCSIKELRTIVDRAYTANAAHINFVAPDKVLIVHENQTEYTFLRTTAFISRSCVLEKQKIYNLKRFLQRAWAQRNRKPDSPFFRLLCESIIIKEDEVIFDDDDTFTFDFVVGLTPMPHISSVNKHTDRLSMSSLDIEKPFIKLKPSIIFDIHKRLQFYGKELVSKFNHINLNEFQMNDEKELAFKRTDEKYKYRYLKDDDEETYYTGDFTLYSDYTKEAFPLYDMDIYMIRQLAYARHIEEVVIIPFQDFYIMELHGEEMVLKTHRKTNVAAEE